VATLEPGRPVGREIRAGAADVYRLQVDSGQFFRIIAGQSKVNLILTLTAPGGKSLVKVDRLTAPATEDLPWIASESGEYQVQVAADQRAESGSYRLEI